MGEGVKNYNTWTVEDLVFTKLLSTYGSMTTCPNEDVQNKLSGRNLENILYMKDKDFVSTN